MKRRKVTIDGNEAAARHNRINGNDFIRSKSYV
jgi:hypothetical protein